MCKNISDPNFNEAVADKLLVFHEMAQNFTYSQKS